MKHFLMRLFILMTGLVFFALGIVITIRANIGYAPWDVFHVGLAHTTGMSIGLASIIVGIVLAIIVMLLGEKLGLGTILNIVLVGVLIDIIFPHVPTAANPIVGTVMMVIGLFVISIGTYFYIKSAFGAGPRDSLMVVLARKTKFSVGLCRSALELFATIAGWFLGGMFGFGTVLVVITIGFCIQITFKAFKFDVTAVRHETLSETYAEIKRILAGSNAPS